MKNPNPTSTLSTFHIIIIISLGESCRAFVTNKSRTHTHTRAQLVSRPANPNLLLIKRAPSSSRCLKRLLPQSKYPERESLSSVIQLFASPRCIRRAMQI